MRYAAVTGPLGAALLMLAVGCGGSGGDAQSGRDAQSGELGLPTSLATPAGAGSGQPHLAVGPRGEVVLSWLEPDGEDYVLERAELRGARWERGASVARGSNWFVNPADFPSVVPIGDDVIIAHWLVSSGDSWFAYDILFSTSTDGGASWSEPSLLNTDGTEAEHGFVSLFPWDDAIGAVWLDGRNVAQQSDHEATDASSADAQPRHGQPGHDQPAHEQPGTRQPAGTERRAEQQAATSSGAASPGSEPAGTSLRYAKISPRGRVIEEGAIDELACDCCQTDAALTAAGPVVVYRDRTADEIRDNVARRFDAATGRWSDAVRLGPDNWRIEGCPVNGPAVAARENDVAAAWFTAGPDATGTERPRVRFAWSSDAGATFEPPVEIDASGAFGHVDVVLLADDRAVVSWWRRAEEGGGSELSARTVARDGTLGPIRVVAATNSSRPVDVPQMVQTGDRLIFAWTDSKDRDRIASAYIDL